MQNDMTIDGFKIAIWKSDHADPPCTATNMTLAAQYIDCLTEEEKTSQTALMAGYYRLVDEAGLVGYGNTEIEAIVDLFSHATFNK